jgi:hypothetical protein
VADAGAVGNCRRSWQLPAFLATAGPRGCCVVPISPCVRKCRVLVRVVGRDLPGRTCGPGPDFPDGHFNIHVAVQGRGQHELFGLVPADVPIATWELECALVKPPPDFDLRGRQLQGPPGARFIYITWGVVGGPGATGATGSTGPGATSPGAFRMFRRAKLTLKDVPLEVMSRACETGLLIGEVKLSDGYGWPVCAAVRPPVVQWSAP